MPIVEILHTHTDGQLYCMAMASRIQAEAMKRRMDRDRADQGGDRRPMRMARRPPEFVEPRKPVSKMTKLEMEAYYQSAGA